MRYIVILLLLISTCKLGKTQEVEGEIAKAVLLFYVSNLIEWSSNDSIESFNIGVLGNNLEFTDKLKDIAKTYTIHNKPIIIKAIDEYQDPGNIHVMFVDKTHHKDIEQILNYCQKYQILQVTDRLENKQYTVVNFINNSNSGDIGYEVNKENLVATSLGYKDELLLYGGSLKDLRELYNSTKRLLEKEVVKVVDLNRDIIKKNAELNLKNASIDSLTAQIFDKKDTLANLLFTIDNQTANLQEQYTILKDAKHQLLKFQSQQQNQLVSIKEKESKVLYLDSAIQVREKFILAQSNTIELKDSTIQAKNRTVLLLSLLASIILLTGVLFYRAYFMKKRNNRILEQKIEKRSGEIIAKNNELKAEINRRKKYETDLAKSEQNYREIFNATTDAICIFNVNGKILDVNKTMLNLYGYTKKEIVKLPVSVLYSQKDDNKDEIVLSYINKAIRKGKTSFDLQAKRNNGELFWVEVALSKTKIAGDECLLCVVRNIDEKKKIAMQLDAYRLHLEYMVENRTSELKEANLALNNTNEKLKVLNNDLEKQKHEINLTLKQLQKAQEQLIDSEKMAAIGIMAAGVAHEINNPLNYIKGGVFGIKSILEKYPQKNDDISELMEGVDLGVDRAAKIVSSLNHFSRQSEILNEECNIHTIIDNCLELLQHTIKNRIKIQKTYSESLIVCSGNEGKIHQVILNIITNATQAIEDKGEICITTNLSNNKVNIEIKDSGSGIDPENIDKITTPFYTTKDVGKGTGLGLSISKKIINDHKGELLFKSEKNKGTSAIIFLPLLNHDK